MAFPILRKEVFGVHLHLVEEETVYSYIKLRQKGNELVLIEQQPECKKVDLHALQNHPAIVLLITGRGVVHKEDGNGQQNAFDPEKICIQRNGDASIDLFRKDRLNGILDGLMAMKIVPKDIFFGEGLSRHYEKLGLFTSSSNDTISFGDEEFPASLKQALSAALTVFVPNEKVAVQSLERTDTEHENVLFRHKLFQGIKYAILIAGLFILVGVAINILLNHQQKILQADLLENRPQFLQLQKLNKEIEGKQKLFEQNSWIRSSKMSYYVDQISKDIPQGVALNKWAVFTEKPNGVLIEGAVNKSADFNEWVMKLKATPFIDERSISFDYDEISTGNEGKGLFTLMFDING